MRGSRGVGEGRGGATHFLSVKEEFDVFSLQKPKQAKVVSNAGQIHRKKNIGRKKEQMMGGGRKE